MNTWLRRLRRVLGIDPIIYVHPAYLSSARVSAVSELWRQVALWKWEDSLLRYVNRRSALFDPRFGMVGRGPSFLIQIQ